MTREAELLERPDAIPIQINFIPCDAMPGRNRMRMMIIVPAFAKGEDRDPPVVGGEIVGDKAARAPSVGDGVHHPGAVQAHYGADENSPQQKWQTAEDQTSRNPPKEHGNEQSLPGEKEQRDNCPDMKQRHESCSYPVEFVLGRGLTI